MAARIRLINGKGDWTDVPPTGATDADLSHIVNDIISNGGVVDLAGGDCLVEESGTPGMHVKVAAGTVYVENAAWSQNSFEPRVYQVVRDSETTNVSISSNPSGSTRIDVICQKIDKVTTPDDDASNVCPIVVVAGTPGAGVPATPSNHEALAQVTVVSGETSITNSEIADVRREMALGSVGLLSTSNYAPQGFLVNGRIATSVASNDLTVAIKAMDGTDPSASNPVYVRIGNTVRTITSALSVTKNDGTNWMNLGASEHATLENDLFAYLGYNTTDGVVIGFSRIPYARRYGDFSATTTNEKYAAISTITNAVAGDEYENIGRFNAILSATASFNWSLPATSIIINRPIFNTRWLTYTTTWAGFSVDPTGTFKYSIIDSTCFVTYADGASGTSNATTLTFTLPVASLRNAANGGIVYVKDNSANVPAPGHILLTAASAVVNVHKTFYQGAFTNSGAKDVFAAQFFYEF